MTDDEIRRVLLIEAHRCIAEAARSGVAALMKPSSPPRPAAPAPPPVRPSRFDDMIRRAAEEQKAGIITYPPDSRLSTEEATALRSFVASPPAASALEKLLADSCASAFFHLFGLLDGVGDPELADVDPWLGARITAPRDDDDSGGDMLHDAFFETYEEYQSRRAKA